MNQFRECGCEFFAPNIAKVNAPLMLLIARNPESVPLYDGMLFVFCPWCGETLRHVSESSTVTGPENGEDDQPTESDFDQHFDEEEPEGGWATPAQSDSAETKPDAATGVGSFESGILRKTRITYAFDVESASDIGMRAIGMAFSACLGEAVEEANKIGQETERTTFLGPVKIVHWELTGLTSSRA